MIITQIAPAKVNLYLHITGKRADGFHELDSLAVFATKGNAACDTVRVEAADDYQLVFTGPYANFLRNENVDDNLITKAIKIFAHDCGIQANIKITLDKKLPIASGIGGGTADAMAALRGFAILRGIENNHPALLRTAQKLGSDGVVCLHGQPAFMRGTGNDITAAPTLPPVFMLLVNPNIPLATPDVYRARRGEFSNAPPRPPTDNAHDFINWLSQQHNDLQPAACTLCPTINDVLAQMVAQKGCKLARLSGSGATCFGLFTDENVMISAALHLHQTQPDWWVAATGF